MDALSVENLTRLLAEADGAVTVVPADPRFPPIPRAATKGQERVMELVGLISPITRAYIKLMGEHAELLASYEELRVTRNRLEYDISQWQRKCSEVEQVKDAWIEKYKKGWLMRIVDKVLYALFRLAWLVLVVAMIVLPPVLVLQHRAPADCLWFILLGLGLGVIFAITTDHE